MIAGSVRFTALKRTRSPATSKMESAIQNTNENLKKGTYYAHKQYVEFDFLGYCRWLD